MKRVTMILVVAFLLGTIAGGAVGVVVGAFMDSAAWENKRCIMLLPARFEIMLGGVHGAVTYGVWPPSSTSMWDTMWEARTEGLWLAWWSPDSEGDWTVYFIITNYTRSESSSFTPKFPSATKGPCGPMMMQAPSTLVLVIQFTTWKSDRGALSGPVTAALAVGVLALGVVLFLTQKTAGSVGKRTSKENSTCH